MPEITPLLASGIILLGGVIGFLSGLLGVGGGFLLTPMLNIAFGIPMPIAIGSGLCQMIGTAATATMRHWKHSAVDVKLAVIMLGGTLVGVAVGTDLLNALKTAGSVVVLGHEVEWQWLAPMSIYVILLLLVGTTTLIESLGTHRKARNGAAVQRRVGRGLFNRLHIPPMVVLAGTEGTPVALIPVIYVSLFIGVMSGFLGIGGGLVIVPILVYWVGTSTRVAVGTSLVLILINALIGTIAHATTGNVDLALVALILVSSTLGASLGAIVHHRLKAHHIRLALAAILLLSLAVIVMKMLSRFGLLG